MPRQVAGIDLAEHRVGAARGVDDLLTVFAGTGVGGELMLPTRLGELAGAIGAALLVHEASS